MPKPENANNEQDSMIDEVVSHTCKCKEHEPKPRNLILRSDLAGDENGHAKIALCPFAKPAKVHEWSNEESQYIINEDLEYTDGQVLKDGKVFAATVAPSLANMDVDDEQTDSTPDDHSDQGDSSPDTGDHVNLENDELW